MQTTSAAWCQEPRPAVDQAEAAMTRAQSAARLNLDVRPGARLLRRVSTRRPRLAGALRSDGGTTRIGVTDAVVVDGADRGTTEDEGAGATSSSRETPADASRSELASAGEGTSTGNRELDGG